MRRDLVQKPLKKTDSRRLRDEADERPAAARRCARTSRAPGGPTGERPVGAQTSGLR